jgi:hypothetical protein
MTEIALSGAEYSGIHGEVVARLERGRRAAARSVNALMTAAWRIVEFDQGGKEPGELKYVGELWDSLHSSHAANPVSRGEGVL